MSGCGGCTLCCKVMAVPAIHKPPGSWCQACVKGRGCTVYNVRPDQCREYECVWLMSQSTPHPFPASMRPDKSRVVLTINDAEPEFVFLFCDPGYPHAWRRDDLQPFLARIEYEMGLRICVVIGDRVQLVSQGRVITEWSKAAMLKGQFNDYTVARQAAAIAALSEMSAAGVLRGQEHEGDDGGCADGTDERTPDNTGA